MGGFCLKRRSTNLKEDEEFICKDTDTCTGDCGPWCSGYKCSYCTNDCKADNDYPACETKRVTKIIKEEGDKLIDFGR